MRFLRVHNNPSADETNVLLVPHDDQVALVAVILPDGEPVGIACLTRLTADGTEVEIALTVVDRFQNRGMGKLLLGEILRVAQSHDIARFVAIVQRETHAMRNLLAPYDPTRGNDPLSADELTLRVGEGGAVAPALLMLPMGNDAAAVTHG
jgi:GNAT superfamily N-acetyltransferase